MNAVIYARYSSAGQTEQSIDGQLRVCREYAKRENIAIVNEYIDRAKSGTKDNRPAFQKMINDSIKGQFSKIIVYQFDRFARNRRDSINNKYLLRARGVKVISATEPTSDNPENVIIEGLFEDIAEYFSLDLSKKAKRGIRESIIKKQTIGGNILFGYIVENKKIQINEREANIIKFIFQKYADGMSKREIVNMLNEKGYKNKHGKPFTFNSFQNALSNKKYIGQYFFHGDLIEDYYPKIISNELYEKVQERLSINKKSKSSPKSKKIYLLSKKIYCGSCEKLMIGNYGTSKNGKKHFYYSCKKCKIKSLNKDYIEQIVIDAIKKYLIEESNLDFLAKQIYKNIKSNETIYGIKHIEKEIAKISKEIDKISEAYVSANELIRKKLNSKAESLDLEKRNLLKEFSKIKLISQNDMTVDEIKSKILFIVNSNKADKKIIDLFLNSVLVYEKYIAIYLNISSQNQEKTPKGGDLKVFERQIDWQGKALESRTQKDGNILFAKDTNIGIIIKKKNQFNDSSSVPSSLSIK